jgi:hypothetical protein
MSLSLLNPELLAVDIARQALCADYSEPLVLPDYSGPGKSVVCFSAKQVWMDPQELFSMHYFERCAV